MSWLRKLQISEKGHVVGMPIIRDLECRWWRNRDRRNSIRAKDTNFGKVLSVASPMAEYGRFHHSDGQILNVNVLKDSHHAEFVTNLKTHIFAKNGID